MADVTFSSFFGLDRLWVVVLAAAGSAAAVGASLALWWYRGRDRWLGDAAVLTRNPIERIRPLFSHETVLPEFEPPRMGKGRRLLRPAEAGVLINEYVSDDDVAATIVDLAVRGHIRIEEVEGGAEDGDPSYRIVRLLGPKEELQEYEGRLLRAFFEGSVGPSLKTKHGEPTVLVDALGGAFWMEWDAARDALYGQLVRPDGLFLRNPETDRTGDNTVFASTIAMLSLMAMLGLGAQYGAGALALPVVIGAAGLYLDRRAMPCRTGLGRELLRRLLGFRLFLVTAKPYEVESDADRGIMDRYLPYAMVFHCAAEWSARFDELKSMDRMPDWYVAKSHRHGAQPGARPSDRVARMARRPDWT